MVDTAATNSLTGILKGNLHVTPAGLLNQAITKSIYIEGATLGLVNAKYKILHIEAGTLIVGGYLVTDVAQNATVDIGDETDDDEFGSAMSLNSTATALAWDDIVCKYYASANELSILPSATLTTSKFWIVVRVIKLNKS